MPAVVAVASSLYIRRGLFAAKELHEFTTLNFSPIQGVVADATLGFLAYSFGNFFSVVWNYQARAYVRERLRVEKGLNFSRRQFMADHDGDLLADYSMVQQYSPTLLSDRTIKDMRKLATDDPEKLSTLRDLHQEFAKGAPRREEKLADFRFNSTPTVDPDQAPDNSHLFKERDEVASFFNIPEDEHVNENKREAAR